MNNTKLRWGILGAAEIARKNWQAIRNSGNGLVTAVASRDLERSRRFIKDCQSEAPFEVQPEPLGNYEALVGHKNVDAIYIPLPTGLRKTWVLRAAAAGKHIVCEKPCGGSVADVEEMVEACRRHNVQFMDGVMFVHSRRLDRIREVLTDRVSVGDIKRITSAFSFRAPDEFNNIRAHSELEPLGCLGDLGWYCVCLALWIMNWQMPRRVSGRLLAQLARQDSPAPVPAEFSGELEFEGGVSAGFYCSFLNAHQQWATISGTKGYLKIPDFVLPFSGNEIAFDIVCSEYVVRGCDFNMVEGRQRIVVPEHSNSAAAAQETNLFRNFASQIQTGSLNSSWPEVALKTQRIVNACLDSAISGNPRIEPR